MLPTRFMIIKMFKNILACHCAKFQAEREQRAPISWFAFQMPVMTKAGLEPGAGNPIQVSYVGGRDPAA